MSTKLEKLKIKALEVEKVVNAAYTTFKTISKKEAAGNILTDIEKKQLEVVTDVLQKAVNGDDDIEKKIIDQALPLMSSSALAKLSDVLQTIGGWTNLLTYHSNGISNDDLIVDTSVRAVKPTYAAGENRKYLGLPDDVLGYANRPTLDILGRGSLFTYIRTDIHGKIDGASPEMFMKNNSYVISLNFRLKRFPSKVVDFGNGNHKAVSTRRTEIAKFNYGTWTQNTKGGTKARERSISIGAVAPFAKETWEVVDERSGEKIATKKESRKYTSLKDPFSIGVCVPDAGGHFQTVYTDYKFTLNTWYNVKIQFDYMDQGTGEPSVYVSVKVNNVVESLAKTRGKLWSRSKNKWRRQLGTSKGELSSFSVASQPGFLTAAGFRENTKVDGIKNLLRVENDTQQYLGENRRSDGSWTFTFDQLNRVVTPPYDAPSKSIGQLVDLNLSPVWELLYQPKRAWNGRKQSMNTAIDYGDVFVDILNIEYVPKKKPRG